MPSKQGCHNNCPKKNLVSPTCIVPGRFLPEPDPRQTECKRRKGESSQPVVFPCPPCRKKSAGVRWPNNRPLAKQTRLQDLASGQSGSQAGLKFLHSQLIR